VPSTQIAAKLIISLGALFQMILGLRCSSKDYAFAVLNGKRTHPQVADQGHIPFPVGYSRVQAITWFYHELNGVLDRHSCSQIVLKAFEGMVRNASFVERIEHEAVAYLSAHGKGIRLVTRKVKSTIAKDMGLKGRGKYLATLDTSAIANFNDLPDKVQEAVLAAWSALP
jgi:hypothetical protein